MTLATRLTALAGAFCLVLTPLAAVAQPSPVPSAQQFRSAQTWLETRVNQANQGAATMPLLSSPADGAMVRTALDRRGLALVDFTNLETGMQVCLPAVAIPQACLMAGISNPDTAIVSPTADQIRQMGENSALYHDELSLGVSFMIDCFGQILAPFETFWNGLAPALQAERRAGVVQVRDGSTQMYAGGINMLTEAVYSEANKSQVLDTLIRNGGEFAKVMTLAQRAQVRATINDSLQAAPASLQARLTALRTTFSGASCTGLCAI